MSANSDGVDYPLRPLDGGLDEDLQRETVREWLTPRDSQGLRNPERDPGAALSTIARLIRSGDLSRASRTRLDDWWRTGAETPEQARALVASLEKTALSLAASAKTLLTDALAATPSKPLDSLCRTRDQAESVFVALGHAAACEVGGADESERRVHAALQEIDALAEAHDGELADAMCRFGEPSQTPQQVDDPWLARIARLDDAPWWCQLLTAREVRQGPRFRAAARRNVIRFKRTQIAASLSMSMGSGEAGALDVLLERPLGPNIALLFDGAVEVYAVTFPHADHHQSVAGLLLREKEGGASHIESVKLAPPGPIAPSKSKVDLAWWVPLAGTADSDRDLVVSYREGPSSASEQESLRLELDG